ncbi:protease [Lithospermum erythrorhizon]|uniref:Protease n=1 Tax=Lithospermum erythrorhizon TaxID=34254 RepID=A0AAV3S1B1_LITER
MKNHCLKTIVTILALNLFIQIQLSLSLKELMSIKKPTLPMLILPLKTQKIQSNKLSFTHNVTLTVSLAVGAPPQNVTMVLDTGSELSWLHCNTTNPGQPKFDPTRSNSYRPISCSSSICASRTQDFSIPASCDSRNLCHAVLSYADMSSSEGNLAVDTFTIVESNFSSTVFGCMDSGYSSNLDEDIKSTGLMGMNRGSLSFVSQMGFKNFSYCISSSDFSGVLLFGGSNYTLSLPLNYTPLVQMSTPLPYFDRVAYTVHLEGIKVENKLLQIPKSVFVPDHTGAGQTMVDSGTQFSFILGPAYTALRNEFVNQTKGIMRVLDEPDYVFQGAMDLCFLLPLNGSGISLLPSVTLVFRGAEMRVRAEQLLFRVPGETRGSDSVHCFTFGNSDLIAIEAYIIGHHHQQNQWMEFDLLRSRIGIAQARCDVVGQRFNL